MIMRDTHLLGPWVRRFLLEYLVSERNLARNTQQGYRDTLCQLIPFVANQLHKPIDQISVIDVSASITRKFLLQVESVRGCSIATRNQRLACIHALARFIGEHSPEHIDWCAQVRCVPFKKTTAAVVPYVISAFVIEPSLCGVQMPKPQGKQPKRHI
jgi:integrase/recombinase XerD